MIRTEVVQAIEDALRKGYRVELLQDKNGQIIAQTISRKKLNPAPGENTPKYRPDRDTQTKPNIEPTP